MVTGRRTSRSSDRAPRWTHRDSATHPESSFSSIFLRVLSKRLASSSCGVQNPSLFVSNESKVALSIAIFSPERFSRPSARKQRASSVIVSLPSPSCAQYNGESCKRARMATAVVHIVS